MLFETHLRYRVLVLAYLQPVLIISVALILLAGCPAGTQEQAPSLDSCTNAGEKCRLRPGQLGVCMPDKNQMLVCMSQH